MSTESRYGLGNTMPRSFKTSQSDEYFAISTKPTPISDISKRSDFEK